MAALGGPVKTGASYLFDSSSIGQMLQTAKDQYVTTPLANNVVAPYGFGAETDADKLAVNPASHAVSTMMVDAIASALGLQGAKKGAEGIVTAGGGFGKKVDAADAIPKGLGNSIAPVRPLEVTTAKDARSRAVVGDGLEGDHTPSAAALRAAEEKRLGRSLEAHEERDCLLYTSRCV